MNTSKSTKPRRRRWLWVILFLFFILLCVGAGGLWLVRSRSVQARDLGPAVSLSSPATGALLDLGTPLRVVATGSDPKGITRLELYVGGVLTAVQTSQPTGASNSLEGFAASWTPTSPGRYLLMARGYRSDGHFADSSLVTVDVVKAPANVTGPLAGILPAPAGQPCPSLDQLAASLGISIDDLLVLNPSLRGTEAGSPVACTTDVTLPRPATAPPGLDGGTPGGSSSSTGGSSPAVTPPPPAPLPGTPAIPTWTAVDASACPSVNLAWTGSPDAQGYTLYRNAPGESHLNLLVHLPASQTSYTDTISVAGSYTYQVAAVQGGLEALSVTRSFNTGDYPACASHLRSTEPPAGSLLYLILPSLQTNSAYEGVYCYFSIDGGAQGRLPAPDFSILTPLSDGLSYDLQTPAGRGHYVLTRTGSDPVTLEMHCMGRRGVYSDSLGGFLASHPSPEWDGHELTSTGTGGTGAFTVQYCITNDPALVNCISGSASTPPALLPVTPPLAPLLFAVDLPAPTNLRFGDGSAICDAIPNIWDRLACTFSMMGSGPQMAWDWTGAGPYTESTLTGYHISATVNGSPWHDWDVSPGTTKTDEIVLAGLPCGSNVFFYVTAMQGDLRSAPSSPYVSPTTACPTRARLLVTFDSLTLGPSPVNGRIFDAGDVCIICNDHEFELDGSFSANQLGMPDTNYVEWKGYATGEDFVRVTAPATFNLSDQLMGSDSMTSGQTNNNDIVLDLGGDNPSVHLWMYFLEHDALGALGNDCSYSLDTPARSISDWASINQTITLTSDAAHPNYASTFGAVDDLGCSVTVRMVGQPIP